MNKLGKEIQELAKEILYHKNLYYRGHPEISDIQYDKLEERLADISPDHPVLSYVGDLTGKESGQARIAHSVPMLSLQKTYAVEDLLQWCGSHEVVGSWKVDGNSLSVVYQGGKVSVGKTRGDGVFGENVTEKVKWVSDIVPRIEQPSGKIEVRGELFCSLANFLLLSEEMVRLGLEKPSNPRNIVSGMLGRKGYFELLRFFSFFAFEVLGADHLNFPSELEKSKWLTQQGFRVPGTQLLRNKQEIADFLDRVRLKMDDGEIGLDGAVFTYNQTSIHQQLGSTSHHPRYKMSFKWQGESAQSIIKSIEWSTSRLGIVTPVAKIEPVQLSGAKIVNVTLHNAQHVRSYDLKAGDRIEIVRSGEVIPKFLQVIASGKGKMLLPEHCPSCGEALFFDEVRLVCLHNICPAQVSGGILNWIRAVEIEDLSEKRLNNLIELGLVKGIADLYRLSEVDFLKLPLTKEKMATKLFKNIQATRQLPLPRFLNGLGVAGMGQTSWQKLLQFFPSLEKIRQCRVEDILAQHGFAEKSASQLVDSLAAKSELIDELLALGVSPFFEEESFGRGVLADKLIVITGSLSKPRKEWESLIKEAGGKTTSSVSTHTTFLLCNDENSTSSKSKKAVSLGIEIWSENQLENFLEEKG